MGEAKRRAAHFDHKVKRPDGPASEALDAAAGAFLLALIDGIGPQLPQTCCEQHRSQMLAASVLTTGFMMLAGRLAKAGLIDGPDAAAHALKALKVEIFGAGLPAFDPSEAPN
ncbi:MAG: hypothetical protein IPK75_01445 [Acidobacteria bacterium]|nr:hypothetical protein [Acidobacteriota bacterium]